MNQPKEIQIETVNFCNARCDMCPIKDMTRPKEFMPDDKVYKLIGQALEFPLEKLHLFLNGEPLIDKRMPDFIRYAQEKKKFKETKTILFSNGSLLTEEMAEGLIDNLDIIVFSINAATKETYEKITNLNFKNTTDNIKNFLKKKGNKKPEVVCQMIEREETKNEVEEFKRMWEGQSINIVPYLYNYGQGVILHDVSKRDRLCLRMENILCVLSDGKVCLCCFDYDGRFIIGNTNKQTLKEVWEGNKRREVMEKYPNIPICRNCNSY